MNALKSKAMSWVAVRPMPGKLQIDFRTLSQSKDYVLIIVEGAKNDCRDDRERTRCTLKRVPAVLQRSRVVLGGKELTVPLPLSWSTSGPVLIDLYLGKLYTRDFTREPGGRVPVASICCSFVRSLFECVKRSSRCWCWSLLRASCTGGGGELLHLFNSTAT